MESTGQAKAEAQSRAEAAKIEGEAAVEQAKLKAEASKIEAISLTMYKSKIRLQNHLHTKYIVGFFKLLKFSKCLIFTFLQFCFHKWPSSKLT